MQTVAASGPGPGAHALQCWRQHIDASGGSEWYRKLSLLAFVLSEEMAAVGGKMLFWQKKKKATRIPYSNSYPITLFYRYDGHAEEGLVLYAHPSYQGCLWRST